MADNKNKSILIIEDEQALLQALQLKFDKLGYDVKIAADGEQGMQAALDYNPKVILLDIMMPHIDGFSLLQLLKDNKNTKDIKVILLTNLGQEGDKKRGLELGAVDYLIKAEKSLEEIVETVNKYL